MNSQQQGSGIHGNRECVRCGACCFFPSITEGRRCGTLVFKRKDEPCKFLSMAANGEFFCDIHEKGDRPEACKSFECYSPYFSYRFTPQFREGLLAASKRVKEIYESGENLQFEMQKAKRGVVSDFLYYLQTKFGYE
jgi:hypothetical protein